MLPADLTAERDRRERQAFRAVAVDIRQARINATTLEAIGLDGLADDCQARRTTAAEARSYVAYIRDMQRDRKMRALLDAHTAGIIATRDAMAAVIALRKTQQARAE